ncbi:MAG: polysaccharide deacetylase family protein [Rhodobacteraceae bacterium]|nr:polysaccharide deacetylase family protein [Paracoccaceae bacterium]
MRPTTAGLCMTFDDKFVIPWHSCMDIFERYDVKATFFLCWPHMLRQREKRLLRKLSAAGHEIGCHTMSHARINKFMQTGTIEDYLAQEIDPAKAAIEDLLGKPCTSFSYPYFKHRDYMNGHLLERFDVVRTEGALNVGWQGSVVPPEGGRLVKTYCMTDKTGMALPISYYSVRFAHLAKTGGYGVTCGHSTGSYMPKNTRMICTKDDLEVICALAQAYGLTFHTVSELANPASAQQPKAKPVMRVV